MVRRFEVYSFGKDTGLSLYISGGQINSVLSDLRKDFGDVELRPFSDRSVAIEEAAS